MAVVIHNKSSQEWMVIQKFCTEKLDDFRSQNDNDLDSVETAKLRGKIEFALEILSLGEVEEKIEITDTKYVD